MKILGARSERPYTAESRTSADRHPRSRAEFPPMLSVAAHPLLPLFPDNGSVKSIPSLILTISDDEGAAKVNPELEETGLRSPDSGKVIEPGGGGGGVAVPNPGKAPEEPVSTEESEVDWTQYDAPAVLLDLPDNTPETIRAVVQSSLENIRTQILAEKQRAKEVEEQAARDRDREQAVEEAQAQTSQGKGKGKAADDEPTFLAPITPSVSIETAGPSKAPKKGLFGFRRKLQQLMVSDVKGESSQMAAQRPRTRGSSFGGGDVNKPAPFTQFIYKHIRHSSEVLAVGETIECVSCLEDINPKDGVKTSCHTYCKECFERLISTAIDTEAQWPPKCCLNPVPPRTITKNICGDLLKHYKEKAEEFKIPIEDRLYCSEPDCGEWLRKVDKATKRATCSKGHQMCVLCRQPAHATGIACPQDRDQQMADQLAEDEGWRHCIKCNVLVEHREACQHMTCRCGAEFCYVCGARWRTCSCSMEQLQAYKAAADERRRAREQREQARLAKEREDEEWMATMIRLIEEREAAERQKEEEERERLRRAREEQRRREAEERARREAARQAELDTKYRELRATLLKLNNTQRTSLDVGHERASWEAVGTAGNEMTELEEKQKIELEESRAVASEKIRDATLEWDRDYHARVRWEKQLEEEYYMALKAFWGGRAGGMYQIDMAMGLYMKKNDGLMDAWKKWQERELENLQFTINDEQAIKEELMGAAKERLLEEHAQKDIELKKRHVAEKRWFEVVIAERTRLLSEIEMVDRETGEESLDGDHDVFEDAEMFLAPPTPPAK